jgi:transcriptional regulator with XRE-family HTH domain
MPPRKPLPREPLHHQLTERWLRQDLIDLRVSKGLTRRQAAAATGLDVRTIERIERPPGRISAASLARLIHAYQPMSMAVRERLRDTHDLAYQPGWWDRWHDTDLRTAYAEHCELEEICDEMILFAPTIFHGLVQCPEYAAYIQGVSPSPEFREGYRAQRLVELRMERQRRFWASPRRRRVRVLIDEVFFEAEQRGPVQAQTDYVLSLQEQGLLEARFVPLTESFIVPDVFVLFTVGEKMALCQGAFVEHHTPDERTMAGVRNLFEQAWHRAWPLASRKDK